MRIAVGENEGKIVHCFEEITDFRIYETGEALPADFIMSVHNSKDFAETLKRAAVDLLICGSLDYKAEHELAKVHIDLIRDAEGSASDAVMAWKMGYLTPEEGPACSNAHFGK